MWYVEGAAGSIRGGPPCQKRGGTVTFERQAYLGHTDCAASVPECDANSAHRVDCELAIIGDHIKSFLRRSHKIVFLSRLCLIWRILHRDPTPWHARRGMRASSLCPKAVDFNAVSGRVSDSDAGCPMQSWCTRTSCSCVWRGEGMAGDVEGCATCPPQRQRFWSHTGAWPKVERAREGGASEHNPEGSLISELRQQQSRSEFVEDEACTSLWKLSLVTTCNTTNPTAASCVWHGSFCRFPSEYLVCNNVIRESFARFSKVSNCTPLPPRPTTLPSRRCSRGLIRCWIRGVHMALSPNESINTSSKMSTHCAKTQCPSLYPTFQQSNVCTMR